MSDSSAELPPLILVADDVPANVELLFDQLHTLGYRTISADLELPAGTVASRIARCLTRLRDAGNTLVVVEHD